MKKKGASPSRQILQSHILSTTDFTDATDFLKIFYDDALPDLRPLDLRLLDSQQAADAATLLSPSTAIDNFLLV